MKAKTVGIFAKNFAEDMSGVASFKAMAAESKEGHRWAAAGSFFMGIMNAASVFAPVDMVGEKVAQRFLPKLESGLVRKGLVHELSDRMLSQGISGRFFGNIKIFGHTMGIESKTERSLFDNLIVQKNTKDLESEYINKIINIGKSKGNDISFHDASVTYNKIIEQFQQKSASFYHIGMAKAEIIQIGWTGVVAGGQTKNEIKSNTTNTSSSTTSTTNTSSSTTSTTNTSSSTSSTDNSTSATSTTTNSTATTSMAYIGIRQAAS